jgi:hypothetical protein
MLKFYESHLVFRLEDAPTEEKKAIEENPATP